jgi:hypothetical protein
VVPSVVAHETNSKAAQPRTLLLEVLRRELRKRFLRWSNYQVLYFTPFPAKVWHRGWRWADRFINLLSLSLAC